MFNSIRLRKSPRDTWQIFKDYFLNGSWLQSRSHKCCLFRICRCLSVYICVLFRHTEGTDAARLRINTEITSGYNFHEVKWFRNFLSCYQIVSPEEMNFPILFVNECFCFGYKTVVLKKPTWHRASVNLCNKYFQIVLMCFE